MALKDRARFGMSLPHRSPQSLDVSEVVRVAQRAEALGFADLWVTENTLDHVNSFDPAVVLSFVGGQTSTIRLGISVMVLPVRHPVHVAHEVASLDYLTGGRAILGVGLGRAGHYEEFAVSPERRVRRFREGLDLIKALWTQERVNYQGDFYQLQDASIPLKPVQKPHPPVWMGGAHPDAVNRAAKLADGWMGAGGQSRQSFLESVTVLRTALESAGRDVQTYPVSKRVFMMVDEKADVARESLAEWFGQVYGNADATDTNGIYGTPADVQEQLEALIEAGCNHVLLNPVARFSDQVEALAEVVSKR